MEPRPTPSTFSSRDRKFYRYPRRRKIRKLPSYANLGLVTGQDLQGQVLTRCFSLRVALESRLMQRVFFPQTQLTEAPACASTDKAAEVSRSAHGGYDARGERRDRRRIRSSSGAQGESTYLMS